MSASKKSAATRSKPATEAKPAPEAVAKPAASHAKPAPRESKPSGRPVTGKSSERHRPAPDAVLGSVTNDPSPFISRADRPGSGVPGPAAAPVEKPEPRVPAVPEAAYPDITKPVPGGAERATAAAVFGLSVPRLMKRAGYGLDRLRTGVRKIQQSMDPRLQMAAARAYLGVTRAAQASTEINELPVVARVTEAAAWEAISEVRPGATLGKTDEGGYIVTGRVPVKRIEAIRAQSCVLSLKAAQTVRPALEATIEETQVRADLLPARTEPRGGQGVVIGIIDFGCDFAHENFRTADGKTRIEAIWHQAGAMGPDSPFGYGRLHRRAEIDDALQTANPYVTLNYGPQKDTAQSRGTHGTHVMDIGAGNGRGSGVPGCAPEATIIFVDLSADDIPWEGTEAVGKSFGDSVRLLEALKFVFNEAGDRPCVVNLSLGTNGGPHDGTTPVEQGMDVLLREKENRSIVIAASNSFADGIHAGGTAPAGGSADLHWMQTRDYEPAELEIWLPGSAQAAVELLAPDGSSVGTIEPGDSRQFGEQNQILVFIANRLNEPNNRDNSIGIFLAGTFEAGQWTVRLHARGTGDVPYQAWIERYDFAQSSFTEPHDNSSTLGSISCGRETIVVGSYDAHKPARPISWFSSAGPTRDNRQKPEVSAPGQDVIAAWSRTTNQRTRKSGTSMASPAVAGLIALMYAEAARKSRKLSAGSVRDLLIQHAQKNPPAAGAWDPRFGHGRVNATVLAHV